MHVDRLVGLTELEDDGVIKSRRLLFFLCLCSVVSANVTIGYWLAKQPLLGGYPLLYFVFLLCLDYTPLLFEILRQYLVFWEVCDVAHAVVGEGLFGLFLWFSLWELLEGILLFKSSLFLFYVFQEFFDICHGVGFGFFVFLATRAVNVVVLLACKVSNYSFQLWWKVSLRPIQLKRLHIFREFLQLDGILVSFVAQRSYRVTSGFGVLFGLLFSFVFFLAKFDQSFLVLAELVFEDLVDYLQFGHLVQIVPHQMLHVVAWYFHFEKGCFERRFLEGVRVVEGVHIRISISAILLCLLLMALNPDWRLLSWFCPTGASAYRRLPICLGIRGPMTSRGIKIEGNGSAVNVSVSIVHFYLVRFVNLSLILLASWSIWITLERLRCAHRFRDRSCGVVLLPWPRFRRLHFHRNVSVLDIGRWDFRGGA